MTPKLILFFSILSLALPVVAQETDSLFAATREDAPKLFIDCHSCDMNYIRTELNIVNYVIDRNDADVFIMITRQTTGGNGRAYTMTLEGRQQFQGMRDTLIYITEQDLSQDEIRGRTLQWLKLGLVRYLSKTPLANDLELNFHRMDAKEQPLDPWDYWVFTSSMDGWFNGQSSYSSMNFYARLSASRVTEDWKLIFNLRTNYNENRYIVDDDEIVSIERNPGFNSTVVKSVSDHVSLGARYGMFNSTYANIDKSIWFKPTIEYNIFPFSESTRREFRFQYMLEFKMNDYHEISIYNKTDEVIMRQALDIDFEFNDHWGSAELSVEGSHYFHDLDLNRLDIDGELSLKILKGFSYHIRGGYALIHDQIALPRGEVTAEDILLHQQELETQYSYWGSMGISYTFGSIYNNIVNPRL